jgi:hypothetical protein
MLLLCGPKMISRVVPIQDVWPSDPKMKLPEIWREPKLDADYFRIFRWGFPLKGSHNRRVPKIGGVT